MEFDKENRIADEECRTGIESYEQKLERWKEGWRREIDKDLEEGK